MMEACAREKEGKFPTMANFGTMLNVQRLMELRANRLEEPL